MNTSALRLSLIEPDSDEEYEDFIRDPIGYQLFIIENFAKIVENRGALVSEVDQGEKVHWLDGFRKSIRVDKSKVMLTTGYETLNEAIVSLTAILTTLVQSINKHRNVSVTVAILRLLGRLARVYHGFMDSISNKEFVNLMRKIITSQNRLISDPGHCLIAYLANSSYENAFLFRPISDAILQQAVSREIRPGPGNVLLKVNPALAAFAEIITKLAVMRDWPMTGIFQLLTKYVGVYSRNVCICDAYFRILRAFVRANAPDTARALSVGGSVFVTIAHDILYSEPTAALVSALAFMRSCASSNRDILSYILCDAPISRIIGFCHHEQDPYLRSESWRCLASLVRYETEEDVSYFNEIVNHGVLAEALECWNESCAGEILGIIDLFGMCIPFLDECCFDAPLFISKTLDVLRLSENESAMMSLRALNALYEKMAVWGTLGEFMGVWEEMGGSATLSELDDDDDVADAVESLLAKIAET